MRITHQIAPQDVVVGHCDRAWLNDKPISLKGIGRKLAAITNDTVCIRLENDGVSAEFTLRIEVATDTDIEGIDDCFLRVARSRRLDMRAIEEFIAGARAYPSAIGYADGISNYFYGVLAKEESLESSLAYDAYREKFNQAADVLKEFDRPLSRTIGALIAYHFNHFSESAALAKTCRVGVASQRFSCWLDGSKPGVGKLTPARFDLSLEPLLTDFDTERLLAWSVATTDSLLPWLDDMESMIRKDIPEFDRTKLRILLSELYVQTGNLVKAKGHASELRNSATLGDWSERILDPQSGTE